jgi:hypothetical protein
MQKLYQNKYTTELEARQGARALGNKYVCIIKSWPDGYKDSQLNPDNPTFYLEWGVSLGFVRFWEVLIYEGKGNKA